MKSNKNKFDLIYKNSGRAAAHKIQQIAFDVARSNAKDNSGIPPLMSEEGKKLAKNSAPRSPFDIPYLDDSRERFAVSDDERETWRRFKAGDDPSHIQPDPLTELVAEQSDKQEPHEGYDEPEQDDDEEPAEESEAEENIQLSRTGGAFDRQRLYTAIDRLVRRTKKHFTKARDEGRSYGRDDGRSYSTTHGCIGGATEWNRMFASGEIS